MLGALTADGLNDMVRIRGHLDRFQYSDIFEDNAILFINRHCSDFLQNEQVFWLADNSPIHTAGVVQDFFGLMFPQMHSHGLRGRRTPIQSNTYGPELRTT
jgi:hypothetical protein